MEFIGEKFVTDKDGARVPTMEYVSWLETEIVRLKLELQKHSLPSGRRTRLCEDDYLPYPDSDYDQ